MLDRKFSQIPITKDDNFAALLTADTVVRWLGSQVADDVFSLRETQICDVLPYAEDPENYSFAPRETTLFEVLERFRNFEARGKRLDAILMTQTGKKSEAFLGIVTVADLPKLLSKLQP
jgi:predicted transcriptional regulator